MCVCTPRAGREDLQYAGKKIIVIGTAATALQIVPELAREAAQLTVFQRSPTWVFVHPEYRRAISPGEQWAIDHLPGYARWYRVILYNWAMDGAPAHMLIDPEWTGGPQAVSAANEASRIRLTDGMKAAIGDYPDLARKTHSQLSALCKTSESRRRRIFPRFLPAQCASLHGWRGALR